MSYNSGNTNVEISELPVASALSDNFTNPTTTTVGAMTMLWDGSTWDRAPGDATNGALVNLGSNNDVTVTGTVGITNTSIIGPGDPVVDSYASIAIDEVTGANQALVSAPGANKQIWVYGYSFTVDTDATTVEFQDEDDTVLCSYADGFKQYGGISKTPNGNFAMPLFKVATNKALEVDVATGGISGELQYGIIDVS